MPENFAKVGVRDLKLILKKQLKSKINQGYVNHIHAIGFRLAGDAFAHLPTAEKVVVSGYSQRLDKKTGHTRDDYLFSVKIPRKDWESINFQNLNGIDPIACLENFELRRNTEKKGSLSKIEPFKA